MIVARSWNQKQSSTLARAYSDSTLIPLSVNNLLAVLASVSDTSSSLDPLHLALLLAGLQYWKSPKWRTVSPRHLIETLSLILTNKRRVKVQRVKCDRCSVSAVTRPWLLSWYLDV